MTASFAGKRVLITGALGGIGRATTAEFAAAGAHVMATDIDPRGHTALQDHFADVVYAHHDISQASHWAKIMEEAASRWSGLDILVNNAAYLSDAPLRDLEEEMFRRHIDINLIGTWLGMRSAAETMAAQGTGGVIINMASISGVVGHPKRGAYAATKWAIRGLTRTAALEWANDGIRVCAIVPGAVDTPMSRRARGYDPDQSLCDMPLPEVPLKRFGNAAEIAKAILYLSSDAASYITGSELVLDGGLLLKH
jgi:3alpha(or 20beta)-hydroxysteroid dehydrogenase